MRKYLPIALLLASFSSPKAFAGPYISASPQMLSSFNYTTGSGPSASQTVVLQSAIMAISSGTVTVASPADYELSLNNSSFSGTVSIPYSGDTLAATNLYVRLKSGLAAGAYMNKMINVAATGISLAITASGLVTSPCIITTGAVTDKSASFTWTTTGAASYECTIDQSANAPATSGSAVATTSYTQSSLSPNTNYYFHVRGVGAGNNFTAWTTKAFKTTSATGVTNAPGKSFYISLLPNPNHGTFTVSGTLNGKGNSHLPIVVINALGQVVCNTVVVSENNAFSKTIQLSAPAGMYTVYAGTGTEYSVVRFSIAP